MKALVDQIFSELEPHIRAAIEAAIATGFETGQAASRPTPLKAFKIRSTVFEVLNAVREVTGFSDLREPSRSRRSDGDRLAARWTAAAILREDLHLSSTETARLLGYEDHTTVLRAVREYRNRPEVLTLATRARARLAAKGSSAA